MKEAGVLPGSPEKGRQIIAAAAEVHGIAEYRQFKTIELVFRDDWSGLTTKIAGRPWDNELMSFSYELGSFNGRATFLEGEEKGTVYGLQSWRSYIARPGAEIEETATKRSTFFVPAIIYLLELPFRTANIPIISYLDETELNGKTYHRIFLTWNKVEPHKEADQYILWVNKGNHRIELAQYTVRESFRFVKAAISYEDFRDINGVQIPFISRIMKSPEDDGFLHRITVESAVFDAIPEEALHPLPDVQWLEDEKISQAD